ncbi:hypothetical protein SAY87_020844 [Trapa incisa]|uniref:Exopolygalacturonase n=1 Tax=Trapa incisa TaxID=236973 RepID=A0AAN7JR02_9MYRT|nr:hypothetical protein SAY87_020844 [Trapa incisa]
MLSCTAGYGRRLVSSLFVVFFLSRGGWKEVQGSVMKGKHQTRRGFIPAAMFNVKSFGAAADGHTDDSNAFLAAWNKACRFRGKVGILVPRGTYLLGPVRFAGPCRRASSVTFRNKARPRRNHGQLNFGYLKASTDLSKYKPGGGWIEFAWTEDLTVTGGGTFNGQGAEAWPYNNCSRNINCKLLPTNLKFIAMNRAVVRGITSVNSKFFHIAVVDCMNFRGSDLRISAPEDSPNTDGIHVERSTGVDISKSQIGTGDDCISIGQGNSQVTLTSINCGPGHGISVGSLGKYPNEGDVRGLVVRDCTISRTANGIRIKTWLDSPSSSSASNMTFENITMNDVRNPIMIDQAYCPFSSCSSKASNSADQ